MGLLVGPVELLLLQGEVPADHDSATAREISARGTYRTIKSFDAWIIIRLLSDFIIL